MNVLGMGIGRVPFLGSWHVPSRPGGSKRWMPPLTIVRGSGEGCSSMDQRSLGHSNPDLEYLAHQKPKTKNQKPKNANKLPW